MQRTIELECSDGDILWVSVSEATDCVRIVFSLRSNGDVDISISIAEFEKLVKLLAPFTETESPSRLRKGD
jgi:hypothetical protein